MAADPRPAKRIKADHLGWQLLRSVILQRPCGICGEQATECHHLYPKGQGGDDLQVNLVGLCRGCHERVTVNDPAFTRELPITTGFVAYLVGKLGGEEQAWSWIDRQVFQKFPKSASAARLSDETDPVPGWRAAGAGQSGAVRGDSPSAPAAPVPHSRRA